MNTQRIAKEEKLSFNIYQKISAVMADVSYVKKEDKKVNNQYRFVAHDAVVAALNPCFVKHGIVVIPTVTSISQDGNRTTINMKIKFTNCDDPADFIEVDYPGFGIDQGDKGPGKALSYAFKYALLKTFCLETGEQDPEYVANSKYEPSKVEELKINEDLNKGEIEEYLDIWEQKGVDRTKFKDFLEESAKKREWTLKKCTVAFDKKPEYTLEQFNNWLGSKTA